jgi:uncharacterized protein (DUF488 family)
LPLIVMTIGHATRPVKAFIQLLKADQLYRLIDARTVPLWRHNPQFKRSELSPALHSSRLHYTYMPGLGGFRHARADCLSAGWHNASFRGFADYLQTPAFTRHLDELIKLAKSERIAIMCAEAVPWRCRRSLIADALLARGIEVREITSATRTYVGHAPSWESCEIRGDLEKRDVCAIYRREGRMMAVATIGRDRLSLRVEAALEQGDTAAVESILRDQ